VLGYLHPLLPALWKSPARKYRRRRGNGVGLGDSEQEDSNAECTASTNRPQRKGGEWKKYQIRMAAKKAVPG